ncbi:ribosomal protein S2 [Neolentinus lepideus HHB14362 ss-1]|uniref:Ribosomal protein S2 n=1 Tax=Neolentinus lepideus HHB14362 ss-1 TaxID=1314782 RepID=A0A165UQL6_9AGAM|nr:ribosomal protein S2 [Neolentinus lepideus HHB14362 ss-1]
MASSSSWLAAAKSSSRYVKPWVGSRIFTRSISAQDALNSKEMPLETPEDWLKFQRQRVARNGLYEYMSQYGSTQTRENSFQPHHTLHRPVAPGQLTLSALVASGAHFGHSKTLMNPNFIPYAYGTRAGITIIDLDQTLPLLRRAANLVRSITANDGTVIFVGTRPDLRPAVRKAAERLGEQGYYVGEKWLPGTLTNKMHMFGSDVESWRVVPDLVVFLNPINNTYAIRECAVEHIPTIGIIDSNVDPRVVMYPIPANDESTRTAELIAGVLSIAGREGVLINQERMEASERRRASSFGQ